MESWLLRRMVCERLSIGEVAGSKDQDVSNVQQYGQEIICESPYRFVRSRHMFEADILRNRGHQKLPLDAAPHWESMCLLMTGRPFQCWDPVSKKERIRRRLDGVQAPFCARYRCWSGVFPVVAAAHPIHNAMAVHVSRGWATNLLF